MLVSPSGLRHCPFKATSPVQIWLRVPNLFAGDIMPKIFAATYTVYFEAFDLKTAQKFAPLLCNRMTASLRANSWITDNSSVVVYNEGVEINEVTKQQHQLALDWSPDESCWGDLSQRTMNHISGASYG